MRIMPFSFDRKKQNTIGVRQVPAVDQQRSYRAIIADKRLRCAEDAAGIGDGVGQCER